jgi:hypothetical protein
MTQRPQPALAFHHYTASRNRRKHDNGKTCRRFEKKLQAGHHDLASHLELPF